MWPQKAHEKRFKGSVQENLEQLSIGQFALFVSQLHMQLTDKAAARSHKDALHSHAGFDCISPGFWQKVWPQKSRKSSSFIINLDSYLVYNHSQNLDPSGRLCGLHVGLFCKDLSACVLAIKLFSQELFSLVIHTSRSPETFPEGLIGLFMAMNKA